MSRWLLVNIPYPYRHGDLYFLWMGACIVCGDLAYEESGKIPERVFARVAYVQMTNMIMMLTKIPHSRRE